MSLSIQLNGEPTRLDNVQTVADLVKHLGYENKRIAIEMNGSIVTRSQYAQTSLKENDDLEIITAVGGG